MKILNLIKYFLIFIIWFIIIIYIQNNFKKITEWDNSHIDINILNKNNLFYNKLFTFGNDWIFTTIEEHSLPIDFVWALDIWINKWISDSNNFNYIDNLLKLYWYRGHSYITIYDNILNNIVVNQDIKNKYKNIFYNNLKKEKSFTLTNKDYIELNKFLLPKINIDLKLPYNKNYNALYRDIAIQSFKNKDYNTSTYFFLIDWANDKLALWKSMLILSYWKYLEWKWDKELVENYNKYKKELYKLSILLKQLTINQPIKNLHRNTTKKDNIISINKAYTHAMNALTNKYINIINLEK